MNPVAVPTHRKELTRREEWRLRWLPALGRVIVVALVFAGLGVNALPRVMGWTEALPWHPWLEHRWLLCGDDDTHFALYSRHPRYCDSAARAPLDCAATCETPVGRTSWDVCEDRCPDDRLARMNPWR